MSHRLADAERRLGVSLFRRGPDRRLTPTTHGVAVHQAAERLLGELRRLEDAITGRPSGVVATVRLGVSTYEAFHWYPDFLTAMARSRPDIELDLISIGDDPVSALAARTIDIALVLAEPAGATELRRALYDEHVFVCARGHPLADRDRIEPSDLAAETYLTYNPLPSPGFEYDRFIRPASDDPLIVRVIRQSSAIVELVAAGVGVSILSRWGVSTALAAGRISAARCGDGLPITWDTATRPNEDLAADVARSPTTSSWPTATTAAPSSEDGSIARFTTNANNTRSTSVVNFRRPNTSARAVSTPSWDDSPSRSPTTPIGRDDTTDRPSPGSTRSSPASGSPR